MGVLARHWEKLDGNTVRCRLCPHECIIKEGKSGLCLIRKNIDGMLQQTAYGEACSISLDPIEKKPLYHFHPGSQILSVGTNGCNMRCRFCQNWQISTQETPRQTTTPEKLIKLSRGNNSIGIAYTYNEPLIWYEFVYDCAKAVKADGQLNVLVTNGQINEEPLAELLPYIDALNIDLKGFTEDFYKGEGGDLKTTMKTIESAAKAGRHIEITNLLIPDINDNPQTFDEMCRFIAGINRYIPLHISRYFPQYKSSQDITSDEMLTEFRELAKKHLHYVFIGNAAIPHTSDTVCPHCGELIIGRSGYSINIKTDDDKCTNCSKRLYIHF